VFQFLGRVHIASQCPTKKTMILSDIDIYSSQDEESSNKSEDSCEDKCKDTNHEHETQIQKEKVPQQSIS